MNGTTGVDPQRLKQRIVDFARDASMEVSPHDEKELPDLVQFLAPGSEVYVAHTPKTTLQELARIACKVQEMGFKACMHVVARRIPSESELRAALKQLRAAGCDRVLNIAGDLTPPAGPYSSTLDIIDSGVITDSGFKIAGFAGHPEGNPNIGTDDLWKALAAKQAFAERSGVGVRLVTQFGFNPKAVVDWNRQLRERGIRLPVHVGFAGPTPMDKLIKYAMLCGISASLKAAVTNPGLIASLAKAAQAVDQVLTTVVREWPDADRALLVKPHFFAFGGSVATARWIRAVRDGKFSMHADASGFTAKT
ncbi:MAG: methylenetetrahydrofolate reductase [Gammaproteobacteria bacterium]|nr:methylenetetrahydrofolate reductase [Gammaproteobacteria bacterium]